MLTLLFVLIVLFIALVAVAYVHRLPSSSTAAPTQVRGYSHARENARRSRQLARSIIHCN